MYNKRTIALLTSIGVLGGLAPSGATAQGANMLEEVTVTARKKEESILKVPVTVTALGGQTLEKFKMEDMKSVAERVPGLTIGTGQGSFGGYVVLRGVGHSLRSATTDTSSSLNIDGMQFSSGLAYNLGMFDVAQVEVLKGPQALFYGKNSPAGVISLRTQDPGDDLEVIVRGSHEFEAEQYQGELIVSGPISETLGMRLGISLDDRESYFKNEANQDVLAPNNGGGITPPENFDEAEEFIGRLTTVWKPSDSFSARWKLNYSDYENEGDAGHMQVTSCPDGTGGPSTFFTGDDTIPFITGENCKLDDTFNISWIDPDFYPQGIANNGVPFQDRTQFFTTLELTYDITPEWSVTSLTGFWDLEHESMYNACNCSATPTWAVEHGIDREDFTQELRFTSNYDGPLNFMVGGFYQEAEMTSRFYLPANTEVTGAAFGSGDLAFTFLDADANLDVESFSVFAQVQYDISEQLELSVGARYTDEEREMSYFDRLEGGTVAIPGGGITVRPDDDTISTDNISPEVTLTYFPNDELTVFASFKKGFKSGSFNDLYGGTNDDGGTSEKAFDDEEVSGFEIGVKSRLMDGRLIANASVYSYEYKDMQLGALENVDGEFKFPIVNAAEATIDGLEVDATYLVDSVPGLTVFMGANYNKAEFDKFDTASCYPGQTASQGCNLNFDEGTGAFTTQDLSGEPLDKSPEWSAFFGLDYEYALNNGYTLALGATVNYSDDYYTVLNRPADGSTRQDSYTKTGINIALRAPDDTWEVALIGKNLEDEITIGNCSVANIANGSLIQDFAVPDSGSTVQDPVVGSGESICVPERGREVWVEFTYRL